MQFMNENKPTIEELEQKLESLVKKQKDFSKEINELRYEIYNYRLIIPTKVSTPFRSKVSTLFCVKKNKNLACNF